MSSTDSVEISANLGGSIAGIVDASVAGTCGHTWSTGHSFTTGVTNTVPFGYFGEITAISGVPPERWTSKAGSLVGQLRGCSCGDYKKIIHGGVPG